MGINSLKCEIYCFMFSILTIILQAKIKDLYACHINAYTMVQNSQWVNTKFL